jgi:hypothetical protein
VCGFDVVCHVTSINPDDYMIEANPSDRRIRGAMIGNSLPFFEGLTAFDFISLSHEFSYSDGTLRLSFDTEFADSDGTLMTGPDPDINPQSAY